jgi:hypothetical protein
MRFGKRVQRLLAGLITAAFLVTGGLAVATVYAGELGAPRNCCGTSSCEVLDGYWIACDSSTFCRNYTPNFPTCCSMSPGFCAQP